MAEGVQYRLVGVDTTEYFETFQAQPGLEDGYVWLMKSAGQEVAQLATCLPIW